MLVGGVDAITDNRTAMLALTAVFAAVALAMLGLAIPVTASFVIGWVIIGPALLALDVPAPAAAMFVFYYSVLSEVTPPTALAAVGASAVTGGRAIPTMWQALRYAAPAFLVPIAFVLTDPGEYLLGTRAGARGAVGRRGGVRGHRGAVLRRRRVGARRGGGGTDSASVRRRPPPCCCCSSIPSPSWRDRRVCSIAVAFTIIDKRRRT